MGNAAALKCTGSKAVRTIALLILVVLLVSTSAIGSGKRRSIAAESSSITAGQFDYYILALSWAPNFCATHSGNYRECGSGRNIGFVVHGLWPQGEHGRLDQPCEKDSPLAHDVVDVALQSYPDAGLVKHEWDCHGRWSGLSAREYFDTVNRAYRSVNVPQQLRRMSSDSREQGQDLAAEFERANNAPRGSFVATCHDGELVAVEACMTKDLKFRACGGGVHGCAQPLLIRAPR